MAMKRLGLLAAMGLAPCVVAGAQMHVVKNPDSVVRAVGVYEWTGEASKPTASRLVPVTLFINGHLEDAGVYLARPVPFALDTGTVFELRKAGVDEGSLELAYARHRVTSGNGTGSGVGATGSYDDGWFAVGAYKPKPAEKVVALKSGAVAKVEVSGGTGPKFGSTPDASATPGKAGGVDRSTAAGSGTTVSADKDPDAPTMRRRTADTDASSTDDPNDAAERPTLKRRTTPTQEKAARRKKDQASVTSEGDLNDDPDRPSLHRGIPTSRMDEDSLPPLVGIPAGMKQEVAVSDAKDRPQHDFKRDWESDAERAEVTRVMEDEARARLAMYGDAPAATAPPAAAVKAAGAKSRTVRKAVPAAPPVAPVALQNESLEGYTLSYGGAPTYVFEASSPGAGGAARYVTIVAQREPLGTLKVATASVTDATHLDRTPWMRLVDAVDAEASNRASLLFELRAQSTRQFALYRVIGAQAQQVFATEPAE